MNFGRTWEGRLGLWARNADERLMLASFFYFLFASGSHNNMIGMRGRSSGGPLAETGVATKGNQV